MATAADIQTLLRFLTQSAKLPLSVAISLVKPLQSASLTTPAQIASSSLAVLTPIFPTPDDAKKVFNAAKRASKRSSAATTEDASSPRKKRRLSPSTQELTPEQEAEQLESSLKLPASVCDVETLSPVVLFTNRAPLLLAFTLTLLQYTMPRQPLSSRLSLAQAVVSEGARKKAVSLGIEKGDGAEEEGWGHGQPVVRVMGREVRIARRAGYPLARDASGPSDNLAGQTKESESQDIPASEAISKAEIQIGEPGTSDKAGADEEEIALWALDLEALKKSNTTLVSPTKNNGLSGLPIYSPHSARAYLLKSFPSAGSAVETDSEKPVTSRKPKSEVEGKEANLGLLLRALDLLFGSWAKTLHPDELNRRAWSWYVAVRPDVDHGPSGWGGKGKVRLRSILDLMR